MNEMGKFLVIAGLMIAAVGALLWSGVGQGWLGRLPGDIVYRGKNTTFYFPLATSIALSVLLSLILFLVNRFKR